MVNATTSTPLTDEQRHAREQRWWEIRNRISSSGEVPHPGSADQLADDIESWEWGDGTPDGVGQRRALLTPMLSGGYIKMNDILVQAKKAWERPFTFSTPTKTQ